MNGTRRSIAEILKRHQFFVDLPEAYTDLVVGCARNLRIEAGDVLARTGEPANDFFLIRSGRVAVQTVVPGRGPTTLQTLRDGDIGGWSWLFPPYEWTFDLRVVESGLALAVNGRCLREKCDADPQLGYMLMQRFARVMTERLRSTRLQLLDVYGNPANHGGSRRDELDS